MTQSAQISDPVVNIPPPHPVPFTDGINHPDVWLWDSWVARYNGHLHLYCLGLARENAKGEAIAPSEFNDYPFHFRHFISEDEGASWMDKGGVLYPGNLHDRADSANVWSGSVHILPSDEMLFGYTGIDHPTPSRHFVQTIIFATGTPDGPTAFPLTAQSHPVRDREAILAAGYYLPEADRIGHNDGEAGGPILGWRDPFIFETRDGTLHALWSAKIAPRIPAVAHAILARQGSSWTAELQPPIRLPDDADYTQAEVPKLCLCAESGDLLMMISACDRLHEKQPDDEVTKGLRLYRAPDIRGPWRPAFASGSLIEGVDHLFGASFVDRAFSGRSFRIIAPYTVKASGDLPMTFAPIQTIELD